MTTIAERYDYPHARALDREETRRVVVAESLLAGLLDSEAAHFHPLNYALGLARAARQAGVRIFENSRVTGYSRRDPAMIRTGGGLVEASFVVLACNGYLGKLEPRAARKIMPINNFMIATEPLGEDRACELISERVSVHDTRFVVDYFFVSPVIIASCSVGGKTIDVGFRAIFALLSGHIC